MENEVKETKIKHITHTIRRGVGDKTHTSLGLVCEVGAYMIFYAALLSPILILGQIPTDTVELAEEPFACHPNYFVSTLPMLTRFG
jgi:hypothetical protein